MAGGGSGYFPKRNSGLLRELQQAQQDAERQELESAINDYLRSLLMQFNARNAEKIGSHLDLIAAALGKSVELDRLLFGGSVAKHTYVDGLSDVDSLVVLDAKEHSNDAPDKLLDTFVGSLRTNLSKAKIESVERGRMAVTVKFRDGTEIQLLPALRNEGSVFVPNPTTNSWTETDPDAFRTKLTNLNDRLNKLVVPTIKLFKAAMMGLPAQKQISGYHAEALCVQTLSTYQGPPAFKEMLTHALAAGAKRVLTPIADVTKQSIHIDSDLGAANSPQRLIVSDGLATLARRLGGGSDLAKWKDTMEAAQP